MASFLARPTEFKRLTGGFLRRLPKGRARKIAVILTALFLAAVTPMGLTITGEFEVFPERNADIRAPVEAVIAEIFVEEGDTVEAGDTLFQLSNPDYEAKKQDIQSRLGEARARLELLTAGTRSEKVHLARIELETARSRLDHSRTMLAEARIVRDQKIGQARQAVALAEDQLNFAQTERGRYQGLLEKGIITEQKFAEVNQTARIRKSALKDSQANLTMALADDLGQVRREGALATGALDEARARLNLLLAGSRGEELEAARSAVNSLKAQLELVENELASMTVRSPEHGIVVTEHLRDLAGKLVHRGDLIAEVYDFRIIKAELLIPEKEIGDVVVGQTITLKARTYPSRSFEGEVVEIAPRAIHSKDGLFRKTVRVTTKIPNPDLALKPGMTGHGKIYAGDRSILSLMTRRFTRYIRVEFWSWW